MGFLGKLLGNVVGEVMNGALDKAADTISATVKDKLEDILPITPSYTSTDVDSRKEEHTKVEQAQPERKDWTVEALTERLSSIVSEEIVPYSQGRMLRREISPAEIGGIQPYKNYSLGVYENGQPVLFIMVTEHNRANRFFKGAKRAAQNAEIPFVNFFTQFPNKEEYIKQRLHVYITF